MYLALQELEALLVENFHKLGLEVLVAVPGAPRHRAVRLQVVQHVHLLLGRLHTANTGAVRQETSYLHRNIRLFQRGSAHSDGFDGLDEFLALQVLQDLVDLRQRKVALKADLSAPDACGTKPHFNT